METGGGEPQKRLAKTKKLMMSADYSNTMRITKLCHHYLTAINVESECANVYAKKEVYYVLVEGIDRRE